MREEKILKREKLETNGLVGERNMTQKKLKNNQ